jgi:putative sterol carrier protein
VETIEELMRSIPERAASVGATDCDGVYHFTFGGAHKPDWTIRIADGDCQVTEGLLGQSDCTIRMDEQTFLGIQTGSVDPQMAFMTGKIKVSNLMLMMGFAKVLWDPSS